ncbi:MAG: hypothetical protein ACRDYX_19480 [Egibacteraceae bacterium]
MTGIDLAARASTQNVVSFDDGTAFGWYSSAVAVKFCPYLAAAEQGGLLYGHEHVLPDMDQTWLEAEIFSLGVIHTEAFRRARHRLGARERVLLCDNLVFVPAAGSASWDGRRLLAWPHWALKFLYTGAGVMFGKFWAGEASEARSGLPIPPPPCNFLSIRSAVKAKDPRFFTKAASLESELLAASDHGQNVHASFTRVDPTDFSVELLRESGYYDTVRERAERLVPNRRGQA